MNLYIPHECMILNSAGLVTHYTPAEISISAPCKNVCYICFFFGRSGHLKKQLIMMFYWKIKVMCYLLCFLQKHLYTNLLHIYNIT